MIHYIPHFVQYSLNIRGIVSMKCKKNKMSLTGLNAARVLGLASLTIVLSWTAYVRIERFGKMCLNKYSQSSTGVLQKTKPVGENQTRYTRQ